MHLRNLYSKSNLRYIPCLIIALFMVCFSLLGQEKKPLDTITVTATGVGNNIDEALKDAFKNAVRRAVGVYVLTETSMDSNENINEKVYANADATISSHTVIDTQTLPNNLVNITIKAQVLKGVIGQRMKKEKTTEINQTSIINVTNHLDAMEEAQKSLDLLFKDFPACLLNVSAINQPKLDQSQDTSQDIIPMLQEVRISIDYHKYEQFVEKLTKLFNSLGYNRGKKTNLTEENCWAFGKKDGFRNCICIIKCKNPKMMSTKIQDLNCQIYRLPGQIIRYMEKYRKYAVLHYELSDADDNVVAERNIFNNPNFLSYVHGIGTLGTYIGTLNHDGSFRYWKDYPSATTEKIILCPLFTNNWRDLEQGIGGYFDYEDKLSFFYQFFLRLQVSRELYKNTQKLKINITIKNLDEGKLEIPLDD